MNALLDDWVAPTALPQTILIIDDNPNNLETLTEYLSGYAIEVLVARDGVQGIARAKLTRPGLILLDIVMPGMDGFEVCRQLKADVSTQNIPVIFITALAEMEHKVKGFQLGAADYIIKPFQKEEVLARVLAHLRLSALTENLEQEIQERTAALLRANRQLEQEIAERKRAEAALSESEIKYRNLVEYANDGIVIVQDGVVKFSNRYLADLCGFTPEEVQDRPFGEFIAPDELERVSGYYHQRLTGEDVPRIYESAIRHQDGSIVAVELNVNMVLYQGHPAAQVIVRDITARKQADAERARLQAQLQQAQKMESIGRLAGGVAHDFNNMLGVILGHSEMALEQVNPSQPIWADLEEIRKAAEYSANLTRQLLAFARKQTIAPHTLDLNKTVEKMLKMIRRLIGEDIQLVWRPDAAPWPVKMDPTQIDQILTNLCVNARDAIDGVGQVTIETANATFDEADCVGHVGFVPGEYVVLVVSDTGHGMDRNVIEHLFEPFFTTKKAGQGVGLGLATVYGIVKQNDGFIYVYSEPGRGTAFKIYLPRHMGEAIEVQPENPPESPRYGQEIVLLVEDEPAILNMDKRVLERLGYQVLAASTPGEAMLLAEGRAGQIDLLITDVVMPEMNGRDLAQRLLSRYPDIKCLFMSGYTADVIAPHGVLDEGVHFIQKPFSIKALAAQVRAVLNRI